MPDSAVAWLAQVGVAVEVDQANVRVDALGTGDDADRDRAVTADHQGQAPGRDDVGHGIGDVGRHLHDRGQIPPGRLSPVDAEYCPRQVACVGDGQASRAQPVNQPRGPQGGGCPILAGVVRPGTRRDSDHHPLSHGWLPRVVTVKPRMLVTRTLARWRAVRNQLNSNDGDAGGSRD